MSSGLVIRAPGQCRYDLVALGDVMLRFDPGHDRLRSARSFDVYEGGGEYNVARALCRCFGLRAAVATALADNELGRLCEELMRAAGVDTSWIRWSDFVGFGQAVRVGLNFTERGFGIRPPRAVSDRGHTAAAQMAVNDIDWQELLGSGVRWMHTGGAFAALSPTAPDIIEHVVETAHSHGAMVSFDPNYRSSLWAARGGRVAAREVFRRLAGLVDVLLGDPRDFLYGSTDMSIEAALDAVIAAFPNISVIASPVREVHSASSHSWGGLGWDRHAGVVHATRPSVIAVLDRVGGGDAFAAGVIYGLLCDKGLTTALEYGVSHGALVMTTAGDGSFATLPEVEDLLIGRPCHIDR